MPNAWFRMYAEFADDPKVQMMSEAMQRRLAMLFCLRCLGKPIETFRETEIAFKWRITMQDLAETKALFIENGFIDDNWNVLNWNKRQYVSDSSTERVRQYRERLKQDETLLKQDVTGDVTTPEQKQNRTDTEQKQETKKQKPSAKAKPSQFTLPDWVDKDAWDGFEEMRKKKRAPMTDRAREGIIHDLEKLCPVGDSGAAVLDQSTKKCWSGVFPLSKNNGGFNAAVPTGKTDANMAICAELIAEDQYRSRANENGGVQASEAKQNGRATLFLDSGAVGHEGVSGGNGYSF
jgi:hypothetical protein